jgi:molecular chaperone GrpE
MSEVEVSNENNLEENHTHDFGINADENAAGTTHLQEPVSEETELETLKEAIEIQKDKFLRLSAEFDNYKRRTNREWRDMRETAAKDVIQSLLEVLDDCDRAEKQIKESSDVQSVKDGVQLIFGKLRTRLQSQGLNEMESIGQDFDVDKHEAITELSVSSEKAGKVVDEVEKGYFLNGKIIRFAKVVVGK